MITLIWLGILAVAFVVYLQQVYSRFSKYGVAQFKPVPILGNMGPVAMKKYHVAEDINNLYKKFRNERFVGRFELVRPMVILHDLELVKKVCVKDFEHFLNHRKIVDDEIDPMFGRSLFLLRGHEWKDMRSTLSPAFTSSKMRAMVPFMVDVNEQMINSLMEKIKDSETGYIDLDCKDLTTRYANDVIASCAFGVKVNSHEEVDNEFYLNGKSTTYFGFRRILVYLGYSAFPGLMKRLKVQLFEGESNNFFRSLFKSTMNERESNNIIRPDMIHLLMQAKKGKLIFDEKENEDDGFATADGTELDKRTVNREWSDTDLIAQAVLFFIAGFETVSTAMSFLLHELAVNPDIQERLVKEIRENHISNDGKFNYNCLQSMKYLDMVISEGLRLWPPLVGLDRECIKDYNLGKPNENAKTDYIIRKGEALSIPSWSFHRDPEYFPNPDKFDPERFSDENKAKIKPFTYLPFGVGPRNCIGSRFALCELKVMLYQLLQQMEVTPCEKTQIPAKLGASGFLLVIEGGHWIRLKPRK